MNSIRTTKTKLRKNAKRKQSSTQWLQRQLNDPFVQQARQDGYRARSVYKLIEIDQKHRLISRGMRVVDLGAAPGSWSQYLAKKGANVVAIDLLEIQPIGNIQIIQGDFLEQSSQQALVAALKGGSDLVLSDIAPDASGRRLIDRLKAENIGEAVLNFAAENLVPKGKVLLKLVKGAESELQSVAKSLFVRVRLLRPKATRDGSSEIYMLAESPLQPVRADELPKTPDSD